MDQITLLPIVESLLRIILGLRFLKSGISNVLKWPNAAQTASLIFPYGAYFFALVANVLLVVGAAGVTLGFQTPIAAVMLVAFLIPTFRLHYYWLQVLPASAKIIRESITRDEAKSQFKVFERQAIHSHDVGWEDNAVLLAASLYFAVRGCVAYGLDNLMAGWVIWLF